jgi:hypothetical protein
LVTGVSGIRTVPVVLAGAATGDEAAREVLAAGEKANLAGGAWVFGIAEGVWVRAGRTQRAGGAPGATAIGLAAIDTAIDAAVDAAIDAAIRVATIDTSLRKTEAPIRIGRAIAARIVDRRRSGRLATAGRDRSGQQEVSKESHWLGGRSNPRSG